MYKCRTESPDFHYDDAPDPMDKIELEEARRGFLSDAREGDQLSKQDDK